MFGMVQSGKAALYIYVLVVAASEQILKFHVLIVNHSGEEKFRRI